MRGGRPIAPAARTLTLPAPQGGLNALDAGMAMPPGDCIVLFNMVMSEYGLRARLGSREWANALTGAGDDYVRTGLPFTGSAANGAQNKNFATTSSGIWEVTTSGSASLVFSFASSTGRAGHGVSTVHITDAGHFLLYWDEVNGYHVYSEATGIWTAPAMGVGAGEVSGVDPASLVFGGIFKGRVWAIKADSDELYYLAVRAVYGVMTLLDQGTKFKAGGPARAFYNWTYDGGAGLDDSLVVVSDGGDVVIWQGTDPAEAETFGMKGTWQLGDLPAGRELATEMGGDLWILSRRGLVPMSKLVSGAANPELPTRKIAPLLNAAMLSKATIPGWSCRIHPEEGALIITVPEAEGSATNQLAMSLFNGSWSQYRDLPAYCTWVFGGKMYFGTVDGSVCINDGYIDGRPLADPQEFTPVQYSGISAFQNLGSANQKQLQLIRPRFLGQGQRPSYKVAARYDFDLNEIAPVTLTPGEGSLWDSAVWDDALWGGDYSPSSSVTAGVGIGVNVAIAWRGAAIDRTVLSGFEISITQGGML